MTNCIYLVELVVRDTNYKDDEEIFFNCYWSIVIGEVKFVGRLSLRENA